MVCVVVCCVYVRMKADVVLLCRGRGALCVTLSFFFALSLSLCVYVCDVGAHACK